MKKETKTAKKKAMTIEDLAIITQQGLAGLEQRMNVRFEQVDSELSSVKQKVSSIDSELSSVKQKVSSIDSELSFVKQKVTSIEEEQKETNRRLSSIERKQIGTTLSLDETVHRSEFDGIVHRVEVLEKK